MYYITSTICIVYSNFVVTIKVIYTVTVRNI